ncbi:MAG: hypothetical protein ABL911_04185 [Gallionella sp.]|nr:hypothetical protein [Gallionella sp.]
MVDAGVLNADAHSALINRAALDAAISAQGAEFRNSITAAHAHLFADVAVFVTREQVKQMQAVITAVEAVLKSQAPLLNPLPLGVFYGYDFHLNTQGAHLIEINTNAGGAFLNALLIESQGVTSEGLNETFLEMFRNEWRLARGDAPLTAIAIVDELPESQYLYPEFLLAKAMFERAGITAYIVDPSALQAREEGLYVGEQKIDLIYNRLTDFSLQQFPHIRSAHEKQQVVLTPNPSHYQRYADKSKLAWLTDSVLMSSAGAPQAIIDETIQGIPQTKLVNAVDAEKWWAERKQWFFKPVNGYGSKGAYRGDKITKRVFEEIMNGDYVAQKLAVPGERSVSLDDEVVSLKYDVRCYVYDGQIQLITARLYQGQTTNFRTLGGGFALVSVVE